MLNFGGVLVDISPVFFSTFWGWLAIHVLKTMGFPMFPNNQRLDNPRTRRGVFEPLFFCVCGFFGVLKIFHWLQGLVDDLRGWWFWTPSTSELQVFSFHSHSETSRWFLLGKKTYQNHIENYWSERVAWLKVVTIFKSTRTKARNLDSVWLKCWLKTHQWTENP